MFIKKKVRVDLKQYMGMLDLFSFVKILRMHVNSRSVVPFNSLYIYISLYIYFILVWLKKLVGYWLQNFATKREEEEMPSRLSWVRLGWAD